MKRILLIEDDSSILENTVELLELKGYEILEAVNGRVGLQIALEEMPDLIICDVRMPEMNGFEVQERLQADEKAKKIPFIFCTASAQRDEVEKGTRAGASAYIVKPYEEETLYKQIEKFIGEAASH